jgi:hypothetical protein
LLGAGVHIDVGEDQEAPTFADYPQQTLLADLADQADQDIRQCLDAGAPSVQLDFTEGRLPLQLDPSGGVLRQFIELNNTVLARFFRPAACPARDAHVPERRPGLGAQPGRRLP